MISDQELRGLVTANIGNPRVLAQLAQQRGFGVQDIARVSGYAPDVIASSFQRASVAPPQGVPRPAMAQAPVRPAMPVQQAAPRPTLPAQASPTAVNAVAGTKPAAPPMPAPAAPAASVAPVKPVAPTAPVTPAPTAQAIKPVAPTLPAEADKAFTSGFNTVRPR